MYGLAREAATAFDVDAATGAPSVDADARRRHARRCKVSIGDAGLRPVRARASPTSPSARRPAWLADRLTAAGVRPINNIVDVTNYVMLEIGPSDARVRRREARRARRFACGARAPARRSTTLDGQTRTLDETMLVIADRDTAVAIAGVMGGATSEVSAGTTRIALESAWFQPASVRATSRKLGLKTEASARFERGADIGAPVRALARALALLAADRRRHASSAASPTSIPRPAGAATRRPAARAHLARLLGDTRARRATSSASSRRSASRSTPAADGWRSSVPSFRVDVAREADLIEEVGRHWGFDRIPATFPALRTAPRAVVARASRADRPVRRLLCGAGLQEAVTFTFIEDGGRGAVRARRRPGRASPTRCPRSSRCFARRCCRAWSTRWSTTGGARRTTSGSSRSARSSRPPAASASASAGC